MGLKVKVYNQNAESTGEMELSPKVFGVKANPDLVHQAVVTQMANMRKVLAHTLIRSEVRGGGRRPWRQKGTGRARHCSSRSPIWRGGGITFGPRNDKVYAKNLHKKMRRKALFMALSEKARNSQLIILDKIELEKGKTKEMAKIISALPCKNQSCLLALPNHDKKIFLASRNIKKTNIEDARNLNVLDVLNSKYLLIIKESIKTIEKTFVK